MTRFLVSAVPIKRSDANFYIIGYYRELLMLTMPANRYLISFYKVLGFLNF